MTFESSSHGVKDCHDNSFVYLSGVGLASFVDRAVLNPINAVTQVVDTFAPGAHLSEKIPSLLPDKPINELSGAEKASMIIGSSMGYAVDFFALNKAFGHFLPESKLSRLLQAPMAGGVLGGAFTTSDTHRSDSISTLLTQRAEQTALGFGAGMMHNFSSLVGKEVGLPPKFTEYRATAFAAFIGNRPVDTLKLAGIW